MPIKVAIFVTTAIHKLSHNGQLLWILNINLPGEYACYSGEVRFTKYNVEPYVSRVNESIIYYAPNNDKDI